ncbi:MFS transporter [Thermostaphylospora chromogena]|uniref:MFS transporter, DHA2 family, multidrug resistance protein n=1 Tax=Thermostaphylospora chromogena TaxID=35622 RepID=A0A1H1ALW5_9ACTN|nr:MFS transporter [Thermostaphylospora chromogena]SDQ40491.1 MFS transporter, DHA2 family, multidrug resistance protein [Thermostaphylospora chromogena]
MAATTSPAKSPLEAGRRAWAGLAVLALPMLLLAVDNSVLFLAVPHLSADLDPTPAQELWIMDVYGFMIAGFLITMGALGDRIGRRRLLLIGAAAFGAASVLAAFSISAEMLIAARAVLGIAGATLMPSSLALISTMFRNPRRRGLAIGIFMSCFMGGAAAGPLVGGLLLQWFWWGSVFLIGVPVMALLLATGPFLLPEHRGVGSARLDPVSVALSLAAILPVVYGLKEFAGGGAGWSAAVAVLAGTAFGVIFVRRQRRSADPLLDMSLFRTRAFGSTLGVLLAAMVLQGGFYLLVSQYLQLVEGFSPLQAGMWLVAPSLALVVGSLLSPVIARRAHPGTVIGGGLILSVPGFAVLAMAGDPVVFVAGMTVGFLGTAPIGALGMDMIVGAVPPERAGSASSVAETGGELGIALGIATLGSVGTAVYQAGMAGSLPPGTPPEAADTLAAAVAAAERMPGEAGVWLLEDAGRAFTAGLNVVAWIGAALSGVLAVLALAALRRVRPGGEEG